MNDYKSYFCQMVIADQFQSQNKTYNVLIMVLLHYVGPFKFLALKLKVN